MARDAFLDVVGVGVSSAPARRVMHGHPSPSASRVAGAFAPLAAALAALGFVALTGLSRKFGLPPAMEPYAYGYFLDRYPLFAFALVYGAVRIVAVAAGGGPAGPLRRFVFGAAGLAVLAVAGLYPTFGGLILRGGFAVGGLAFLTGQPLWVAYALGTGISAMMVGGIVGATGLAANGRWRPSLGRIGAGALAFVALWLGAGVIGLAHGLGAGPWPARAFTASEVALCAVLLLLAGLPHAAFQMRRARRAAD